MNNFATWAEWKRAYVRSGKQSPFEWEFLSDVLQNVPGLKPSYVTPQREFVDNEGRTLHMDFAIETPHVLIAIEIEGYDKNGNGLGKSREEHDRFNRRIQSLSAQGWQVLTITNHQFKSDPSKYIIDIGTRIDPRKFEIAPQSTATAPTENVVTQNQLPQQIVVQVPAQSSQKNLMWALIAIGLVILIGLTVVLSQTISGQTPTSGVKPVDKDCGDFSSQAEAQAWYEKYFPEFGDYAQLDGLKGSTGDKQACTSYRY